MKVLFLDMDGVVNSSRSIRAYGDGGYPVCPYPLDEVAIWLIRHVVEVTEAVIVISSSWRGGGPADAATWFVNYGWYNVPLIDETPPRTNYREQCRGDVIQEWLDEHRPEKYVIVDDSGDMLPHQHFVHVDGRQGFSLDDHDRCIEILSD